MRVGYAIISFLHSYNITKLNATLIGYRSLTSLRFDNLIEPTEVQEQVCGGT